MDDDDTTSSIPLLLTRPNMVSSRDGAAVAALAATAGSNIPVRICAEEEAKKQIGTTEPTTTKATATTSSSTTTVLQVEPEPVVPLIANLTLEPVGGIDNSPAQLQEQTREGEQGGGATPGLQMNSNDPPVRVVRTPREANANAIANTTRMSFVQLQHLSTSGTSSSSDSGSDSSSIRYWRCDVSSDSPTQLQDQTQGGEHGGRGGGAAPGLQITTNDPPVRVVRTPREVTATVTARFDLVQQKRPYITSSSSSCAAIGGGDSSSIRWWLCDGCCHCIGGVDRKDLHEADDEEERASSELVPNDATVAAAEAITARRPSASTNGTLRPQGGSSSNEWELTPISVLIRILGYTDNTTLMSMCLVCKHIKELIWSGAGMENKLVRIFELRPSENNDYTNFRQLISPVRRFICNMNRYCQDSTKRRMLQGYQHLKVQDVTEFNDVSFPYDTDDMMERLTRNIRLTGIISLDMSSLVPMKNTYRALFHAMSFMVPNLQQVDLSHAEMKDGILRWNYYGNVAAEDYGIKASGEELQSMNNLRELYFDNNLFEFDWDEIDRAEDNIIDGEYDYEPHNNNEVFEINAMSDSNNYPNTFLLCRLGNKPLTRVSIQNTKFENEMYDHKTIPQNILMKFVRKAPSTLVWFRSDLSSENIRILQTERPGIQLVN